jgi:RNA-directed DNA polymerase
MNSQKTANPEKELSEPVEVKSRGSSDECQYFHNMKISESPMFGSDLMESVLDRNNLIRAFRRVKSNKSASGVDSMTVQELSGYLKENWLLIKEQLQKGEYHPSVVKGVKILKPGKKEKRKLGIPTFLDRFIQQAILQV